MILRIVSSRTPYRRAGVNFEPTGHKSFAVTLVSLDDLDEARLAQLLLDPHLDVAAGTGNAFIPVGAVDEVAELASMLEQVTFQPPPRGTLEVLADHAAMEAERARDAAAPGGDDEDPKDTSAGDLTVEAVEAVRVAIRAATATQENTTAAPAAEAAPPEAASGGEAEAPAALNAGAPNDASTSKAVEALAAEEAPGASTATPAGLENAKPAGAKKR